MSWTTTKAIKSIHCTATIDPSLVVLIFICNIDEVVRKELGSMGYADTLSKYRNVVEAYCDNRPNHLGNILTCR